MVSTDAVSFRLRSYCTLVIAHPFPLPFKRAGKIFVNRLQIGFTCKLVPVRLSTTEGQEGIKAATSIDPHCYEVSLPSCLVCNLH